MQSGRLPETANTLSSRSPNVGLALDMLFDAGLFNSEEEEEPARDTGDVVSWIDSGGKLLTAGPV